MTLPELRQLITHAKASKVPIRYTRDVFEYTAIINEQLFTKMNKAVKYIDDLFTK